MAAVSRSTMLERPRRLHVVGAEGQMVECRFPASGMNLARIEIAFQSPGDIEGVVFEGLDRRGRVDHVIVGDANQIELPDVGRLRVSKGRLRGVRLPMRQV